MRRKREAKALKRRMNMFEKGFIEDVRKRMVELSKDKKLEDETVKELQKRFKV